MREGEGAHTPPNDTRETEGEKPPSHRKRGNRQPREREREGEAIRHPRNRRERIERGGADATQPTQERAR